MSRAVVSLSFAVAALALMAPAAPAVPLIPGKFGPAEAGGLGLVQPGVPSADGDHRYAAVPDDDHSTLLEISTENGEITDTARIDGSYRIPVVALDGTPGGLAHTGDLLVLEDASRSLGDSTTTFAVIDPERLQLIDEISLEGTFAFDALSPNGEILYLIEYPGRNPNNYAVREYDLAQDKLLPDPVLVAHELSPGEMRGLPQTRTTSPDGAWEYTLYDGGGGRSGNAFIHVLDTERGISHCIDLAMVDGNEAWRVGFELTDGGGTLDVIRGDETLAKLDTESFAVTEPIAPELTVTPDGGGPSGLALGAIAVGSVLLIGTALGLRRRRQAASLPPDPFGPGEPAPGEPAETEPGREPERVST